MAHEIESMAYVGELPWHGLGTALAEADWPRLGGRVGPAHNPRHAPRSGTGCESATMSLADGRACDTALAASVFSGFLYEACALALGRWTASWVPGDNGNGRCPVTETRAPGRPHLLRWTGRAGADPRTLREHSGLHGREDHRPPDAPCPGKRLSVFGLRNCGALMIADIDTDDQASRGRGMGMGRPRFSLHRESSPVYRPGWREWPSGAPAPLAQPGRPGGCL